MSSPVPTESQAHARAAASDRHGPVPAIDWLRGLVSALKKDDHAGNVFDAEQLHRDSAAHWVAGTQLPGRRVPHTLGDAPLRSGLHSPGRRVLGDVRREAPRTPGQTRFIVTRGLLIAALDPLWMSLGFTGYSRFVFQVLYAIGLSLVFMAGLRRVPSSVLLAGAIAIQLFGELADAWHPTVQPLATLWAFLFLGGPVFERAFCAYPLVPWLSVMMLGWVLGRWLLQHPNGRAMPVGALGAGLLAVFAAVRGVDGYGNWNLHRDSADALQWLHVAKYPPSLAYMSLELGIGLLLLALFLRLDETGRPLRVLAPLSVLGATAFFYYLLHVHLMAGFEALVGLDRVSGGLAKTWAAAGVTLLVLWPLCALYRRYKAAHPNGWTRYV